MPAQNWFARLLRSRRSRGQSRWVVVDVETSGLDTSSDVLISIGAVAMVAGRIVPADSIEIIVQQAKPSARENILVHGVGAQAQKSGVAPAAAVGAFLEFAATAPMIAFHAPFDRAFIARATSYYVNQPFDNPWLDLAELAPVLAPGAGCSSLDDWLQRYGIPVSTRHSAAADAFATALLAARLLPEARRQRAGDFATMQRLARSALRLR